MHVETYRKRRYTNERLNVFTLYMSKSFHLPYLSRLSVAWIRNGRVSECGLEQSCANSLTKQKSAICMDLMLSA